MKGVRLIFELANQFKMNYTTEMVNVNTFLAEGDRNMSTTMKDEGVGERIFNLMRDRGVTDKELEEHLGIGKGMVSHWNMEDETRISIILTLYVTFWERIRIIYFGALWKVQMN